VVGFTSGIAVVIFSTQIRDALGLDIAKVPTDFIDKWKMFYNHIDHINYYALAVTLVTIGIILLFSKLKTKVPGSFIAIIGMTAIVQLFDLPVTTIESFFGDIPAKFDFVIPNFQFDNLSMYLQPALTIALLGAIESLLSAVVSDGMIGGNHRSNTELIAQGIANIVTPFFGGIPATGAIARTATNVKNGGRTPVAGIVHSITLLLIMLFFGQWAKLIPMSVLAGVLIIVAYNMSEWRSFMSILHSSSFDIIILFSTFLLTIFVDLTVAIEIGIVLSALLFMRRMSKLGPALSDEIDTDLISDYSDLPKDFSVYEISGPLFFASAKQYTEVIKILGLSSKILIIRMRLCHLWMPLPFIISWRY
jgi:SulP family sulfate permease